MPETQTPEEIFEKQSQRMTAAVEDVKRGVSRVTESPTAKAALAGDKAIAGFAKAVQSGKWGAALKRVTLDMWKEKTIAKADRIPAGVQASRERIIEFNANRQTAQKEIDAKLKGMPSNTLS